MPSAPQWWLWGWVGVGRATRRGWGKVSVCLDHRSGDPGTRACPYCPNASAAGPRRLAVTLAVATLQLTMNDFSVHRIIGRGGFGEVYGCRKADTGKM